MIRTFFWRRDKSLLLTLSIQCKRVFITKIDICARICYKKTLIASFNGMYYDNKLKIFTLANHLRMDAKTRRQIPQDKQSLFRHIGAWLLQQVVCFLFPSKISQRAVDVSLIADGYILNNENKIVRNHAKLVAYYEKLGFNDTESDEDFGVTQLETTADVIVNKTRRLR